ncbi:MAG: hypothetical protein IJN07_00750 [Clostridia bacterium]|nr:hypothetical protein [Clostridia bacterium]
MNHPLSVSKGKATLAILFTSLFILGSVLGVITQNPIRLNLWFSLLSGVIAPACVLIFLITGKKEYRLKNALLPIAFSILTFESLLGLIMFVKQWQVSSFLSRSLTVFILPMLLLVAHILSLWGSLNPIKFLSLLRIGTLVSVLLAIAELLSFLPRVFMYISYELLNPLPLLFSAGIQYLFTILFYVGIFLLTTGKRQKENA